MRRKVKRSEGSGILIGNPLGEESMLALLATSSGEWRGELRRSGQERHAHRRPSKVRGAMLALPTMLKRGQHAHR